MRFNRRVFCFCLYVTFVKCTVNDLGELVFVNILFRHGDRSPVEAYPNDPYKNISFWPNGWGQLTKIGMLGHYELGKWLRKRYDGFLPKQYNMSDIYVQSTDVDRTLMSAESNLAGLYEPDSNSNWNPHIKWAPIPVHTVPEHLDKVLAAKAPCPRYNLELQKLYNSPEFIKINKDSKPLYDYLTKHTGKNVTSIDDAEYIYDTLFIEDLHKLKLPDWVKGYYPEPLKRLAEFSFQIPCYTEKLARLKVGLLLGDMLGHLSEKVSGTMKFNRKAWMYSAHDTTVANVLKALDLFQPHCPPYYSLILVELRKKKQEYFVAIHYRNSTEFPPYLMKLKDCDELCPFEKFKTIVSALVPENWDEECKVVELSENVFDTAASISLITIVSFALIFLFSVGVVVKLYKSKRNEADFAYKSLRLDLAL